MQCSGLTQGNQLLITEKAIIRNLLLAALLAAYRYNGFQEGST